MLKQKIAAVLFTMIFILSMASPVFAKGNFIQVIGRGMGPKNSNPKGNFYKFSFTSSKIDAA